MSDSDLPTNPMRKFTIWGAVLAAPWLYFGTLVWAASETDGFLYMLGFAAAAVIFFVYVYTIGMTADMRRRRALRAQR